MILDPVLQGTTQINGIERKKAQALLSIGPTELGEEEHIPIRIAERYEAELCCRVHNEVFRHSAEVGHREARPHHELRDEVAVTDAVHAILRDGFEAELPREELAIDFERVPRKRARAQRQDRYARNKLLQALEICTEGERMREQEVGPPDGLSTLFGCQCTVLDPRWS